MSKECTQCREVKPLSEYYSQVRHSKKRGQYTHYLAACKACQIAKSKEWREANPEKVEEFWKRQNGTPQRKEYLRVRRKSDRPRFAAEARDWRHRNPERTRSYGEKRREIMSQLVNDFKPEQWSECLSFFNHSCAYCGTTEDIQQDHVVPVSKYGATTATNIIPACKGCNCSKNIFDLYEWYPTFEFFSQERYDKIIAYFSHLLVNKYKTKSDNNGLFSMSKNQAS